MKKKKQELQELVNILRAQHNERFKKKSYFTDETKE